MEHLQQVGMPAGNAYPSGHLIPSPNFGLACATIAETRYFELAMSLIDFSPRINPWYFLDFAYNSKCADGPAFILNFVNSTLFESNVSK